MQTMFKHLFSRHRRQTPRESTILTDSRRRPEPMPRIRWY
jgi:hypothetical protein